MDAQEDHSIDLIPRVANLDGTLRPLSQDFTMPTVVIKVLARTA